MKKYEIHLADWQRILLGNAPPMFLLEVFLRTIIVYIFLLFVLRWLGKRMSGQLSITEMAIMLTLGAIVSVSMQTPDRGIALSMFVLFCTLIFQRTVTRLGIWSIRIEELTQGKMSTLLEDGVMDVKEMNRCRISQQQLFARLRGRGIFNLGEVRRVYLEAEGLFTIIKMHAPGVGLSTLPPRDNKVLAVLHHTNDMACTNCGKVIKDQASSNACPSCGANTWTQAVTS